MSSYAIRDLETLLGLSKISSISLENLTSAGDNYASAIFSLNIITETNQIRAVAKMLPKNQLVQDIFNSQKTFRNEVGFYEKIVPSLREFQKRQGLTDLLNSTPEFYAGRISLNPSSPKVDSDGVLIIKNLQEENFSLVDRTIGFDLNQTKLILEKMAELHATVLAFRSLQPDEFESQIGEFFTEYELYDVNKNEELAKEMVDALLNMLKEEEFCRQNLELIRVALMRIFAWDGLKNNKQFQNLSFMSLVHSDLWVNNIMVKPDDVKFVDFQVYEYSSLTRDVFFFLFTSVQLKTLEENVDDFLSFYFHCFVQWLKKLKYESSFTFEGFLDEMGFMVREYEFFHVIHMLRPIYALKKNTKEVDNLNFDDFLLKETELVEEYKSRANFVVREVMRRGWIYA